MHVLRALLHRLQIFHRPHLQFENINKLLTSIFIKLPASLGQIFSFISILFSASTYEQILIISSHIQLLLIVLIRRLLLKTRMDQPVSLPKQQYREGMFNLYTVGKQEQIQVSVSNHQVDQIEIEKNMIKISTNPRRRFQIVWLALIVLTIVGIASFILITKYELIKSETVLGQSRLTQNKRVLEGEKQPNNNPFLLKANHVRPFKNLFELLNHNKVENILQVNCDLKCDKNLEKAVQFPNLKLNHWDGLTLIQYGNHKTYDWINCELLDFCIDLFLRSKFLLKTVNYGVSFRHDSINFAQPGSINKIIAHMADNGFYYDEIKSLNLLRPEDRMVMIFLRGKPEEEVLPFRKPTRNMIATHIVLRMVENVDFLREWIGYHLNLGVDKFFVYDNSNSVKSEMTKYDYLVTAETTKIGLNLACYNKTGAQIKAMWEDIWLQFYEHVVYVQWAPTNDKGEVIYGQMKSLDDYMYYFQDVAKFTAFIDPDEFLFSPDNLDLEQYLLGKEKQNITSLRIKSRHFPHRICTPNKRVTDLVHYYPHNLQNNVRLWAPKYVCVTKLFKPFGSIHDGLTKSGLRVTPPENQLRFNHYTFEFFNLIVGLEYRFSDSTKLEIDDSLQKRYSKVVDDICQSKCSENFAMSCPPGKQFVYCIDPNQTLPSTKADAQKLKYKLEHKNG